MKTTLQMKNNRMENTEVIVLISTNYQTYHTIPRKAAKPNQPYQQQFECLLMYHTIQHNWRCFPPCQILAVSFTATWMFSLPYLTLSIQHEEEKKQVNLVLMIITIVIKNNFVLSILLFIFYIFYLCKTFHKTKTTFGDDWSTRSYCQAQLPLQL